MTDGPLVFRSSEMGTAGLSEDAWKRLLARMDPDPDRAGSIFLDLHFRLVKFFAWEGVLQAEALADDVMNRLAGSDTPIQDLPGFLFGIARNVLRQYRREMQQKPDFPPAEETHENEADMQKLDAALDELAPEDRDLILGYYQAGKPKIVRQDLCVRFKLSPNALRIRVCRIKDKILGKFIIR